VKREKYSRFDVWFGLREIEERKVCLFFIMTKIPLNEKLNIFFILNLISYETYSTFTNLTRKYIKIKLFLLTNKLYKT